MIDRATAAADIRATPAASPINFQVADVAQLPFDDESIDLVVSTISMHHWANLASGLREVVRVLRPGARAWLYDFRPTAGRAARMTLGWNVEVRLENPLTGTWRLNPIGRLVLDRKN